MNVQGSQHEQLDDCQLEKVLNVCAHLPTLTGAPLTHLQKESLVRLGNPFQFQFPESRQGSDQIVSSPMR